MAACGALWCCLVSDCGRNQSDSPGLSDPNLQVKNLDCAPLHLKETATGTQHRTESATDGYSKIKTFHNVTAYPPFHWLPGEPVFLSLSCRIIFHPFRMGTFMTPASLHALWRRGSIISKKPFPSTPVLRAGVRLFEFPPRSVLNRLGRVRRGIRVWLRARRPQGAHQLNTGVFPHIPSLEESKVILKVTNIWQLLIAAKSSVGVRLLILLVVTSVVHVTKVVVITGVAIATYAVPSAAPADQKKTLSGLTWVHLQGTEIQWTCSSPWLIIHDVSPDLFLPSDLFVYCTEHPESK